MRAREAEWAARRCEKAMWREGPAARRGKEAESPNE